jgi:protein-disulfide isomerase
VSGAGEERRRRLLQLASAAAFLTVAVVLVLIVINQSSGDGGDADSIDGTAEVRRELGGLQQQGLLLGNPGAPVTLIEFGDLQCPVCKGYAEEVLPEVIESKVRSGEAKLEFRNFTIISEESVDAAAAAIAAGEQGRGWSFLELFYRNQGIEASGYVTADFMTAIAEGAGVPDIAKWNEARESARARRRVAAQTAEAERLGLGGTPSFAVEGPKTDGLEVLGTPGSAGELEKAIENAG